MLLCLTGNADAESISAMIPQKLLTLGTKIILVRGLSLKNIFLVDERKQLNIVHLGERYVCKDTF